MYGQYFNPSAVTEQLSIMVLSYDSFRTNKKEGRKAFQENSNLAAFAKVLGKPDNPIENADETALFQVINHLNPLVIVDESHHARSNLSLEMLENFNPCFVLDLTATPKKESNVISYVDAVQLKRENMVKLPVIVYNRENQKEVLVDAIDLRNRLEELAAAEQRETGRYLRPIVLFQAEPKGKEEATTFEKIRDSLIDAGIPREEIAIRTADVNELKDTDLMSSACPVRYIITVNALKEGWDCPFAYILASLANKNSQVDVEQIVGRILRLPHTTQHRQKALNQSYVLTSSNDFNTTVQRIVKGLNSAGFSDRDCRVSEPVLPTEQEGPPEQFVLDGMETMDDLKTDPGYPEDSFDVDGKSIGEELQRRREAEQSLEATPKVDAMIAEAERVGQTYDDTMTQVGYDPYIQTMSWEEREKVTTFSVKPEFREEIKTLQLPQFFEAIPNTIFTDGSYVLLDEEQLSSDFTLRDKDTIIDFSAAEDEIREIDVRETEDGLPKVFKMKSAEQRYFKEYFNRIPSENRVRVCKDMVFHKLNKMNGIDAEELRDYLERIAGNMDKDQLSAMEKAVQAYGEKIKNKINYLLKIHCRETFFDWLQTERIICKPSFRLPDQIHPTTHTNIYGKSLYQAEEDNMNRLESDLVYELTALPNVRWWHRNISRQGFCINGFINHYPDLIIRTEKGKIICAETKGEHLKNENSQEKIELGAAWSNHAGSQFRYYMVFKEETDLPKGAVSMSKFLEIIKVL